MSYCTSTDLLIDHQMYTDTNEKDRYVRAAADAMDAKLGFLYVVPVDVASDEFPAHEASLLKKINAELATGRLIMSRSSGGQENNVNQYALFLIKQAEGDLMALANGNVDLHAPRVDSGGDPLGELEDPTANDRFARTPTSWNPDATSAVTFFEKNIMGGYPDSEPWIPAENISGDGANVDIR